MVRPLTVVAVAILFCSLAGAQTATGILQGRVVDPTGASVPDAKVSIENERTGVVHVIATNSEGIFFQSFLLPGNYRVTVEKAGFQKDVTSGTRVDVQQTVSLDVTLKVGDVTNTIEIQARAVVKVA